MNTLSEYLHISPELLQKIVLSTIIFIVLSSLRFSAIYFIKRKDFEPKQAYFFRRTVLYTYSVILILLIVPVWIRGIGSISTFLGLASAGLAIAMHDTIANITGWFFIIWRKPFKVGDRIQINETAGDVIDIRIFQFSLIEIGNWVDADQSSGRIIHVPNSKVLRDPLANYNIGFEFIWPLDVFSNVGLFIGSLGIYTHYESISRGVIDSRDIIYFISVIVFFLLLTRFALASRKW